MYIKGIGLGFVLFESSCLSTQSPSCVGSRELQGSTLAKWASTLSRFITTSFTIRG